MTLFDPILNTLAMKPALIPGAILIRHSVRFPIVDYENVYEAKLTPQGIKIATEFGEVLGKKYTPGRILSTPVGRCVDTAKAIEKGAGWQVPVVEVAWLSHPAIASALDALNGHSNGKHLPASVERLTFGLLERNDAAGDLDVCVSHDTVVAVMVGYYFGEILAYPQNWPNYLDGVAIWKDEWAVHLAWRGKVIDIRNRLGMFI